MRYYSIAIPEIEFNGIMTVKDELVVNFWGQLKNSNNAVTLLPTGTYWNNDNVYNSNPNFTSNGLSFSITNETPELVYYNLYSGFENEEGNISYNKLFFSKNFDDQNDGIDIQSNFIIREIKNINKVNRYLNDLNKLNILGTKTYKIKVPEILLEAQFTINKNYIIESMVGFVGNNPITLLNPSLYPTLNEPNDNKFKNKHLTENGLAFTTSRVNILYFYNLYLENGTKLITGVNQSGLGSTEQNVSIFIDRM